MPVAETSLEAYRMLDGTKCGAIRRQILLRLRNHPGLCRKEITREMGIPFNAISGRFTELQDAGLIIECGRKRYDGRWHFALEITDEGRKLLGARDDGGLPPRPQMTREPQLFI